MTRKRANHNRKNKSDTDPVKGPLPNPFDVENGNDVAHRDLDSLDVETRTSTMQPPPTRMMARRAYPQASDLESVTVPLPQGAILEPEGTPGQRQRVGGGNPIPEVVNRPVVDLLPNSLDVENGNDDEHLMQLTTNPDSTSRRQRRADEANRHVQK